MITAYLLLIVESGKEEITMNKLLETDEVKEIHVVYGQYDLIAKIRVTDIHKMEDFILKEVRRIKDIKETSTLIATRD